MNMLRVVSVAASAIAIAGFAAIVTTAQPDATSFQGPATYRVGDRLPDLPGFDYSEYRFTIFLPISRYCDGCEQTLELYRSIATAADASKSVRAVWLAAEDETLVRPYLGTVGLPQARILAMAAALPGFRAVPSVVIVDRHGIVQFVWTGRRAIDAGDQILATVAKLVSRAPDPASSSCGPS